MIISTFNIQNDINHYKKSKTEEILKYLVNNKIDILGLQEVFSKCNDDLLNIMENSYKMVGEYRYFFKFLKSNEKNPIITKYEILAYKTYYLPSFPSKIKRIMTNVVIKYDSREISVYNTHLEVSLKKVKVNQLNKIYEILKKDQRPKIIMGDFNMKIDTPLFKSFISLLSNLGITRVPIEEKTFKSSKDVKAIDHIFISSEFNLINFKVIKELNISDHYPILVDIK